MITFNKRDQLVLPKFLVVLNIFFFLYVQYFKQDLYPTLCCIIGVDVKVVIVAIIVVVVVVVVIVVVGVDDVDDSLHRDQHE